MIRTPIYGLSKEVPLCTVVLPALLELIRQFERADLRVLLLHLHDRLDDAVDNGIANSANLLVSLPHDPRGNWWWVESLKKWRGLKKKKKKGRPTNNAS